MELPITRGKLLEYLKTKDTWHTREIHPLLCSMTMKDTYTTTSIVKIGDVYDTPLQHPAVVFKINGCLQIT